MDGTESELGPDWIQTKLAFYLSLGFASISVLISMIHIIQHLLHYSMPGIQIYVIRILVICPVYAISSTVALGLGKYGAYAEISRDVYEAFVIYSFFNLILEYSGGETDCIYQIENEPQLRWPCPLCFLKPRPRDARLMRFCLRGVLQFVIIKPIVAVIDIIMIATDNKSKLGYEIFVFIVYNISYAWALYCMFVFYQAISKLIKKFRPILKFASIKAIVFATYYQSLAVQASSMSPENVVKWNDFILCIEMVFFSSLLMIAFPTTEFQGGIPDSKFIENVRSVLSVHDVVQDVYHNFIPVYHDYTLQRSETETPEVVRMKTYLAGNLDSVAIEMSHRYRGRNKRLAFNSLLRGSTPISARLRGSNRPFNRLRTGSEHSSSDVSDSEYYDEENSLASYGSSHDGSLDDSTDSTMELCAAPRPSQEQLQAQQRRGMMPRILPQFNGSAKAKYLVLDDSSSNLKDDEAIDDDDVESGKVIKKLNGRQQPQQLQQSQAQQQREREQQNGKSSQTQTSQRFFPHADRPLTRGGAGATEGGVGKIDYDQPLNLTTISLLSPVEQDIIERRVNAMATHGIGFVVTKKGIEIRPADYFPTEEEGVMNEGFMSVDDSSHHSKYDRESATTSPLSLSLHNPAAANLPRLPKKSQGFQKKPSPEKSPITSSSRATLSSLRSQQQEPSVPKALPLLPSLPPPPSDKLSSPQKHTSGEEEDNPEVADLEDWSWGDFVDHTEEFAEFPATPRCSPQEQQQGQMERGEDGEDDDLSLVYGDDPFDERTDVERIVGRCVRDMVSVIAMSQEDEFVGSTSGSGGVGEEVSESSQSRKSSRDDRSSPSFVMVSEEARSVEERSEGSIGRDSSTESDDRSGVVVFNEAKDGPAVEVAAVVSEQKDEVEAGEREVGVGVTGGEEGQDCAAAVAAEGHGDAFAPPRAAASLLVESNPESEVPNPESSCEDPLLEHSLMEREEDQEVDQLFIFPNPQELSDEIGRAEEGERKCESDKHGEIRDDKPAQNPSDSDVTQPDDSSPKPSGDPLPPDSTL